MTNKQRIKSLENKAQFSYFAQTNSNMNPILRTNTISLAELARMMVINNFMADPDLIANEKNE